MLIVNLFDRLLPSLDSKGNPDSAGAMYQSDDEEDDDEEGSDSSDDDDDDDDADGANNGMQLEGAYDPADYENLPVTPEIKDLFGYITKYIPQVLNKNRCKCCFRVTCSTWAIKMKLSIL